MKYSVEDAMQIFHAKSSTIEFYTSKVARVDWKGINPQDIAKAEEYYSDDDVVDFDLLDRADYEIKVSNGASPLPDADFPVLVIVTIKE